MIDWGLLLLPGAVLLIIPVAIVAGYRRATSSIMLSGALAAIAFATFWLVLGGIEGLGPGTDPGFPLRIALLYGGVLLTLTTWALALNAAAQARRWWWVALLFVAGYLTLAAIYASFSLQNCFSSPDGEFNCLSPDPLRQALIIAGYLACPVAALASGVRTLGRRARTLPDGLVVSSLRAQQRAEAGGVSGHEEGAEGL